MRLLDLTHSLSKALFTAFGDTYKIFYEKVQNGLTEPCFFIQLIPGAGRNDGKNHIWTELTVNITFIPAGENDHGYKDIMYTVRDKLRKEVFGRTLYIKTYDADVSVTCDDANDKFTGTIRELRESSKLLIGTSGTMPAELDAATEYHAVNVTFDDFQISNTLRGTPIAFSAGTGDFHYTSIVERNLTPLNKVERITDDILSYQFDLAFSEGLLIQEKYDIMNTLDLSITYE